MTPLIEGVAADLGRSLPTEVMEFARHLAEQTDALAVLFYGSVLRTGKLDDLLDFYVLTDKDGRAPLIWPRISLPSLGVNSRTVRAKVATMPLELFADAASGRRRDTTIWARFCQPCALAWARDARAASQVADAVAAAIMTAARFAAVLGPRAAPAEAFWTGLFDRTYTAELRVEPPGRSAAIVAHDGSRYAEILPLAWAEAGIAFEREGDVFAPDIAPQLREAWASAWRRRARAGKALNLLRLMKAAFTLRGAFSYARWKIARHRAVTAQSIPWGGRHPG